VARKRGRPPALTPAEVIRMLLRNGFRELRSTKHRHFTDDKDPPHVVTVPHHRRSLKRGTLHSIIRQTGWTLEEFLERL
jgi:predicted RNA binding protein YcfA (HicA-like mRNA interferase family)